MNIEKLRQKRQEFKEAVDAQKPTSVPFKPPDPKTAPKPKSVEQILGEREEDARKQVHGITKVQPYQSSGATYTPVAQTYKKKMEEAAAESYTDRILENVSDVIDSDVLEYELGASYADSSVNRCPHCGWMLTWNSKKCPKCRKDVI